MVRPQVRRLLLLGVPALALAGLLGGLATWLWGRRRQRPSAGRPRTVSREMDATASVSDGERSPERKLRASAEEFYPSSVSLNHLPAPCALSEVPATATDKLGPLPPKTERASLAALVHPTTTLQPSTVLLKGAWIPPSEHQQQPRPVKGRGRPGHPVFDQPTSLQDAVSATVPTTTTVEQQVDSVLAPKTSSVESLTGKGIPLSSSQTTTLSGYSSETLLKTDDSGILVQGRKYPLASSDVQSETFSEIESFGSAEDISTSRQLPVHEDSSIAHSLLLANTEKPPGIISKAAVGAGRNSSAAASGGCGVSGSVSAPSLGVKQCSPPLQASLSMSSRDLESPLLRLDSFKNRVKVTIQLPRDSVGRFIGKQGRNIKSLMADSNTHVYVNQKNLPKEAVSVPCHIQGSATEVELSLKQISMKFPEIDIPGSIEEISTVSATSLGSLSPLFANLEEGINWEVQLRQLPLPKASPFYAMVSYIESLNRLWVFPYDSSRKLDDLHQSMSFFYAYASSMGLQRAKEGDGGIVGRFCAAKVSDIHWLRAHVTKIGDDSKSYELQLVDYGSTVILPPNSIRPLK